MVEGKPPEREEQEHARPDVAAMEAVARGMFAGADPPDPRKRKRGRAREATPPEAAG